MSLPYAVTMYDPRPSLYNVGCRKNVNPFRGQACNTPKPQNLKSQTLDSKPGTLNPKR